MHSVFQRLFSCGRLPWGFIALAGLAVAIQGHAAWQPTLVYNRTATAQGEIWRIWTGQLVHFGWPHLLADVGLFLVLGWLMERKYNTQTYIALVGMPLAIVAALYIGDPDLVRYGGLSGVDFGLLVFLALQGWQRNWIDWFWPAVLAIYIGELVYETTLGHGQGGGVIRFNDPSIHVATMAHVGGGLFGVGLWAVQARRRIVRT